MTSLETPSFSSEYASRLYDFVAFKRREGYKYNGEIGVLRLLDRYFQSHDITPENHSDEDIYSWLAKRSSESDKTFSTRNSVYRQFYKYLTLDNDYVLPTPPNAREKLLGSGFVPYIFTHEEIRRIFECADNENSVGGAFKSCAPLLFRMLYGTGLRINEATSLTVNDVFIDHGILLIREAKNDNSRLVPMSNSLSHRVSEYLAKYSYSGEEYFFQHNDNCPIRSSTAYSWFRLIIWRAGIPHRGRGYGPRMHDLRYPY